MKKITLWKPDTCDCILLYEWDDQIPNDLRVHTPVEENIDHAGLGIKTRRCDDHQESDLGKLHGKVKAENTKKNIVLGLIVDQVLGASEERIERDGSKSKILKSDVLSWSFDKNRKLVIEIKDAKIDKNEIKNIVDSKEITIL